MKRKNEYAVGYDNFRYVVYDKDGISSIDRDFFNLENALNYYDHIVTEIKEDLEAIEAIEAIEHIVVDKVDTSFGLDWLHIGLDGTTIERIRG